MQPAKWWKSRGFRWAAAVLAGSFVVLAFSCWFLRIRRLADLEAYVGMASDGHPVWKALAARKFSPGDPVTNFLAAYPASRKEEFGSYGVYHYDTGGAGAGIQLGTAITLQSRDGRLVTAQAGSCTWSFSFFGSPDAQFDLEYIDYMKKRGERDRAAKD